MEPAASYLTSKTVGNVRVSTASGEVAVYVAGVESVRDGEARRAAASEAALGLRGVALVLGLGLGAVVRAALRSPDVERVEVIEANAHLIEAVWEEARLGAARPSRVSIVNALPIPTVLTRSMVEGRPRLYDSVWLSLERPCLEESSRVRRAFEPCMREGCWYGAMWNGAALRERAAALRRGVSI